MGRFAKRLSGKRPVSLGFELTFLSEFREFVWRVLDRDAKRCACIVKHPPQCHRYSFLIMLLIVLSCIDFNFTFVYNMFYEVYVMKKTIKHNLTILLLYVICWVYCQRKCRNNNRY